MGQSRSLLGTYGQGFVIHPPTAVWMDSNLYFELHFKKLTYVHVNFLIKYWISKYLLLLNYWQLRVHVYLISPIFPSTPLKPNATMTVANDSSISMTAVIPTPVPNVQHKDPGPPPCNNNCHQHRSIWKKRD